MPAKAGRQVGAAFAMQYWTGLSSIGRMICERFRMTQYKLKQGRGGLLDLLRFLASFAILAAHFAFLARGSVRSIQSIAQLDFLATDFFLLLSGFVLALSYRNRDLIFGRFLLDRVVRIWPGHLVMMAAFAALVAATMILGISLKNPHSLMWENFIPAAFLIQAYGIPGPAKFLGRGWNGPTWTLSALLGCYLLFPLMRRWAARLRMPAMWFAAAVLLYTIGNLVSLQLWSISLLHISIRVGFLRALPLFFLGVMAAYALGERKPLFQSKIVAVLGASSFGIYLTHYLLGVVGFNLYDHFSEALRSKAWFDWSYYIFMCAITLVIGHMFAVLIDDPMTTYLKRRLRGRKSVELGKTPSRPVTDERQGPASLNCAP